MKLRQLIILAFTLLSSYSASAATETVAIVPLPAKMSVGSGEFLLPAKSTYAIPSYQGDSIARVFNLVKPEIERNADISLTKSTSKPTISLLLDKDQPSEGYELKVNADGVIITASKPAGFFYGLQTLLQLIGAPAKDTAAAIPYIEIADEPAFGWRGFMLDEGRHFFGKDEVKKVLDLMASYKMNRFHWHLTEDQGWRIEIKKYPKLTETGANRNSKSLGWGSLTPDTVSYGGYYTQDDIRDIVAYAADRFIEIVPEIDIPGHTQAAVASYPEILACDPENPHEVWLMQGVSDDVMNVANPAAVQMSKDIIDELIPLFPFPYLHLGGDECPTDKWKENAQCRAQLDSIGSDNYRDLQLYFYKQLTDHIATKPEADRKKLIFWNEVLHGNTKMLPDDITIMAWVGADKAALDAAERGLTTILTPQIPYYINRRQSPLATEPISQGRGTETLKSVYDYAPLKNVPDNLKDKYMGVQANFWSEYVITPEFLEYLMMPRLAAVAEAGWTPQQLRSYPDFRKRIRSQEPLLKSRDWNYAPHEFVNE